MIVNCPSCSQSIEISPEHAGTSGSCPSCNQEMAFPGPEAFAAESETTATAAPVLKSRASANYQKQPRESKQAATAEAKFSFRRLALQILTILMLAGIVVLMFLPVIMRSNNSEPGAMSIVEERMLPLLGVDSTSQISSATISRWFGRQLIPFLFALVAVLGVFKRTRIAVIIPVVLIFMAQLGAQLGAKMDPMVPILPALCLILACIPGRSKIWGSKEK